MSSSADSHSSQPPTVTAPVDGANHGQADRRAWLALAILALPCVVYAMDLTVLNLALPALSADLRPSGSELLWIVDVYGFLVAGALVTMGALGDRIGARRLLLVGAAAFAAASLLAAFATSAPMLIAARALLGLAGAVIAPSTLSLIRVLFEDPRQRTTAIGIWVTSYSAGAAIGPLAGGALLEVFWWGSVFLLALPVMALVLVLGPRLLPADRPVAGGRLDLFSAGLSLAAVLTVVYGLKQLVVAGVLIAGLPWLAVGAGLGTAFVRRQRVLQSLIDLRLFQRPAFTVALTTNLLSFFVVFGMALFLAQFLQAVLGLPPLEAGLWSVPEALGFIAGSTAVPRLVERFGARALIAGGLFVGAAGYLVVALAESGLAAVVSGATIASVGLGGVVTLTTDSAVDAAPPGQSGIAAATAETSSELGGALGIAVLGAIGTAVFTGGVAAGEPATVGAALAAADSSAAAAAARGAFADALTVTASIGAALLLAGGMLVLALLRSRSVLSQTALPAGAA